MAISLKALCKSLGISQPTWRKYLAAYAQQHGGELPPRVLQIDGVRKLYDLDAARAWLADFETQGTPLSITSPAPSTNARRSQSGDPEPILADDADWRTIPAAPSYQASKDGKIRRRDNGKLIATSRDGEGYNTCKLYIGGRRCSRRVARMVLMAWVGPAPTRRHQAAHNNGVRDMDTLANLTWLLPKENHADRPVHQKEKSYASKLNEADVAAIRYLHANGVTLQSIHDMLKGMVTHQTIRNIIDGATWHGVSAEDGKEIVVRAIDKTAQCNPFLTSVLSFQILPEELPISIKLEVPTFRLKASDFAALTPDEQALYLSSGRTNPRRF